MIGPAIKPIQVHFGIDPRLSAWVIAAFALFTMISVPALSWMADVHGKRKSFLISVGLFVAGALVCAASQSIGVLLFGRVVQGIGAAGVFPVASAVVGDAVPKEKRGMYLGVLGSVFGLAFLIGPAVSGFLLLYGWRYPFLFSVPVGVAALIAGWRILPASKTTSDKRSLDVVGLVLLTLFVGALSGALNSIDSNNFAASLLAPRFYLLAIISILCLVLFVVQERRTTTPIVRPGLFATPGVSLVVLLAIGAGMCEAALVFTAGYAVALFDVTDSVAGFMFLPLAGSIAIASPVLGRLLDKVGPRTMVVAGAAILCGGLVLFALSETRVHFYLGSVLIGVGQASLLGSSLNYIMLMNAPSDERATAQGFVTLSLNFGIVIGSAVVGAIVASAATAAVGFGQAFSVMAVVAFAIGLIGLAIRRK